MCGIAAIVEKHRGRTVDGLMLERMAETLNHRGPDAQGKNIFGHVGLAFRRLSIIDLSASGNQPMCDAGERYWIVFNGEIYNYVELANTLRQKGHTFRTKSDTEVILAAYKEWGRDCVQRFNGMWGMIIYDSKEDTVFCSRDRFGVKPVYYYEDAERILIASEIKALLASKTVPIRENPERSFELVGFGYADTSTETLFKGIHAVEAGHSLVIEPSRKISKHRYWQMPDGIRETGFDEAVVEFKSLFFDSVSLRLRSDVPVAALLSGGQDSSSIVCAVAQEKSRRGENKSGFSTFSSVYDDPALDERQYIRAVIEHTGVRSHFVEPQAVQLVEDLKSIIWHNDEPLQNSNHFAHWMLMKGIAEKGVKVVLSGQGADEILAGYDRHLIGPLVAENVRKGRILEAIDELHFARDKFGFSFSYSLAQSGKTLIPSASWPLVKAFTVEKIGRTYSWPYVFAMRNTFRRRYHGHSRVRTTMLNAFLQHSLPRILHGEDRTSMAHSIEQRFPFLDYRLVEFCFSLPDVFKISRGETKRVMRAALAEILPLHIRQRTSKIGFATPTASWTKELLASEYIRGLLHDSIPGVSGRALREIANPVGEHPQHFQFLWRFVNYLVWRDMFGIRQVPAVTMSP